MTLEVLEILIVVQGMVPDRVVFFCGGMKDRRVLVGEPRQINTILLGIQDFHLPDERRLRSVLSAVVPRGGRNSLARFTVIQSERLILRRSYKLVSPVVKTDARDMSWASLR